MDTWHKFRNKPIRKDLTKMNISELICQGNYLIAEIAWLATQNKLRQRHIDRFFDHANIVLQSTVAQNGYSNADIQGIYEYIDQITKEVMSSSVSLRDLGLMIGNLTELADNNYTFTELVAFMRVFGTKI